MTHYKAGEEVLCIYDFMISPERDEKKVVINSSDTDCVELLLKSSKFLFTKIFRNFKKKIEKLNI